MEKVYTYKTKYYAKDGTTRLYDYKSTRVLNGRVKITNKKLMALIKDIKDPEKRKQIEAAILKIKADDSAQREAQEKLTLVPEQEKSTPVLTSVSMQKPTQTLILCT